MCGGWHGRGHDRRVKRGMLSDSTASLKPQRVPTDGNFSGIGSFFFIKGILR